MSTPDGLESLDMEGLVTFIKSSKCKSIAFLTGAGVSVSSGIPDFRSPGGMYDTLQPHLLTASEKDRQIIKQDPTTVVSWDLFEHNQFPYLELRRPFILGVAEQKWKCTDGHWFPRVVHDKGLLTRVYTQNIDGLDFQIKVPKKKLVSVHGTLGRIECEGCNAEYPMEEFLDAVRKNIKDIYKIDKTAPEESSEIPCKQCSKPLVKPATVLYGRNLPAEFTSNIVSDIGNVDVLFVMGTSLTVSPACNVPKWVRKDCVRVIINNQKVGQYFISYENSKRDIFLKGSCDKICVELMSALGWKEDLDQIKKKNCTTTTTPSTTTSTSTSATTTIITPSTSATTTITPSTSTSTSTSASTTTSATTTTTTTS